MITPHVTYRPSFMDENDIEFLEYSSIELVTDGLVGLVRVVASVLVSVEEVVVVQRAPRP